MRRSPGFRVLSDRTRLAVWGDPIDHSRSPQLHAAAYRVLGLDWSYERRRVTASEFAGVLASLDDRWRGLSVTFPLKAQAFSAARIRDRRAELTGAVNTLLLDASGTRGFNTDVGGITRSLQEHGVSEASHARIIGAGATATSALVALGELGARHVEVAARRPEAVRPLIDLGEHLGVTVISVPLGDTEFAPVPLSIATLPGGTALPDGVSESLAAAGGLLLDVVYGSWPTTLAEAWQKTGAPTVSGLGMLLHQAVLQVRVFVSGDPNVALDAESAVLAAMRSAVVGD